MPREILALVERRMEYAEKAKKLCAERRDKAYRDEKPNTAAIYEASRVCYARLERELADLKREIEAQVASRT